MNVTSSDFLKNERNSIEKNFKLNIENILDTFYSTTLYKTLELKTINKKIEIKNGITPI